MPVYQFRQPPTRRRQGVPDGLRAWLAFAAAVALLWLPPVLGLGIARVPTLVALAVLFAVYWGLGRLR